MVDIVGCNAMACLLMAEMAGVRFAPSLKCGTVLQMFESVLNKQLGDGDAHIRQSGQPVPENIATALRKYVEEQPRLQSRDKGQKLNDWIDKMPHEVKTWCKEAPLRFYFIEQPSRGGGRSSMLYVKCHKRRPGPGVHPLDSYCSESWIVDDGKKISVEARTMLEEYTQKEREPRCSGDVTWPKRQLLSSPVTTLCPRKKRRCK